MATRRVLAIAAGVVASIPAQIVSSYTVSSGSYTVDGYVCGGSKTLIYYPVGDGPYPVIIYLHGSGGDVDGRESGLASVASSGFVIVAPYTGGYPGSCNSTTEYEDAVLAWRTSKSDVALSPGLAKADWNRTGVWGYSMGAKTTHLAAAQQELGVDAIVCSHGARGSANITIPAMFLTGTDDSSSSPQDVMLDQFNAAQSAHKVFSNIQGGTHTRPIDLGTMNPWVAKFFSCHLSDRSADCNAVYGSGDGTLCDANDYAACKVVGATPSPRPGSCTGQSEDPFASGSEVTCCAGLYEDLQDWNGDGREYYKCMSNVTCTEQGGDPYASDSKVPCCSGLDEDLQDWNGGRYYYKCMPAFVV